MGIFGIVFNTCSINFGDILGNMGVTWSNHNSQSSRQSASLFGCPDSQFNKSTRSSGSCSSYKALCLRWTSLPAAWSQISQSPKPSPRRNWIRKPAGHQGHQNRRRHLFELNHVSSSMPNWRPADCYRETSLGHMKCKEFPRFPRYSMILCFHITPFLFALCCTTCGSCSFTYLHQGHLHGLWGKRRNFKQIMPGPQP